MAAQQERAALEQHLQSKVSMAAMQTTMRFRQVHQAQAAAVAH
jgi:hypothetical protein